MKNYYFLILAILPFLLLNNAQAHESHLVFLTPTDDTYIGFDVLDPEDIQELKKMNFGDAKILKLWYAYHSPGYEENEILAYSYLKFDLSEIPSDAIASAKVMMYAAYVDLAFDSIDVGLHNSDTNWSESSMIADTAPQFDTDPIVTVAVNAEDTWYGWDITEFAKDNAGTNLSLAVVFGNISDHDEEAVEFTSKDYANSNVRPFLVIDASGHQEELFGGEELSSSGELSSGGDFGVGIAAGIVIGAGGVAGFVVFMKKTKIKISKE